MHNWFAGIALKQQPLSLTMAAHDTSLCLVPYQRCTVA